MSFVVGADCPEGVVKVAAGVELQVRSTVSLLVSRFSFPIFSFLVSDFCFLVFGFSVSRFSFLFSHFWFLLSPFSFLPCKVCVR